MKKSALYFTLALIAWLIIFVIVLARANTADAAMPQFTATNTSIGWQHTATPTATHTFTSTPTRTATYVPTETATATYAPPATDTPVPSETATVAPTCPTCPGCPTATATPVPPVLTPIYFPLMLRQWEFPCSMTGCK